MVLLNRYPTHHSLLVALVTSMVLISCEGNTRQTIRVTNNTSSSVTVKYEDVYSKSDTEVINAGESGVIYFDEETGAKPEASSPTAYVYTLLITKGQDTCTKDFLNDNNWIIQTEQKKKRPPHWEHEYNFTVSNSDF